MSSRLKHSEPLGRKIRQDDTAELMIPTWALAELAVKTGNIAEGLELFDYGRIELKNAYQTLTLLVALSATFIANNYGENEVERLWRTNAAALMKAAPGIRRHPLELKTQLAAEVQRGHCCGPTEMGEGSFVEEADRYVLTLHPCGSGGRLRQSDFPLGRTKQPHPWSWGQAGVPYYCTHCCVFHELMGIETYGYPLRVHENADWMKGPCIQIFYKSPELIPEKYFTRLGYRKDISRFKKL